MSTIKVTNVQNPSAASAAITLDTNGQATLNGLAYPTSGSLSGRNRIINGDMRIDQRNAGASVTPAGTSYTVDRWQLSISQSSKLSAQQSTVGVDGNTNSLLLTTVAAHTPVSSEEFLITQHIEGFNSADFDWGSAGAQSVSLSFWVRSSLTGTFGGSLRNSATNRSYPFSYTISTADTWEKQTIVVPGDTTGTWLSANDIGIRVAFSLGTGPSLQGTANTWQASSAAAPTSSVNVVATNGATFYITGVQLEAGSVATPFERRSYEQELSLCQRYCFRYGDSTGSDPYARFPMGFATSSSQAYIIFSHPVAMRSTTRSLVTTAPNGFEIITGGYVDTSVTTTMGTDTNTDTTTQINFSDISTTSASVFAARFYNSASANFLISAEL